MMINNILLQFFFHSYLPSLLFLRQSSPFLLFLPLSMCSYWIHTHHSLKQEHYLPPHFFLYSGLIHSSSPYTCVGHSTVIHRHTSLCFYISCTAPSPAAETSSSATQRRGSSFSSSSHLKNHSRTVPPTPIRKNNPYSITIQLTHTCFFLFQGNNKNNSYRSCCSLWTEQKK